MRNHLVLAAHDCSDGGLAVAAAELVIGGNGGLQIDIANIPYEGDKRADFILFSESNGRLLVMVDRGDADRFEQAMNGVPCARIGRLIPDNRLIITAGARPLLSLSGETLYASWSSPLAAFL